MNQYISLLFLVPAIASAEQTDVTPLLKNHFGEMIEFRSDKEIWYCPDNTCALFRAREANPDFPAFVYLHLFHKSGYVYLDERFGGAKAFRNAVTEELNIRKEMTHYCNTESESPDCILENMKLKIGITVGSGRYDEGYFCYSYGKDDRDCEKY